MDESVIEIWSSGSSLEEEESDIEGALKPRLVQSLQVNFTVHVVMCTRCCLHNFLDISARLVFISIASIVGRVTYNFLTGASALCPQHCSKLDSRPSTDNYVIHRMSCGFRNLFRFTMNTALQLTLKRTREHVPSNTTTSTLKYCNDVNFLLGCE